MFRALIMFCFVHCSVYAAQVETFYGNIEVEEPVILELIESPAFQRLKHIHQYGVAYYTTHREEFTRYDHSLGVFALLRAKGCSLKEQIAGLLHDVSHTIFSHVGDWIFNRHCPGDTDYQTLTHTDFLNQAGLSDILSKYGYIAEELQPTQESFPALEQPLPNLCADRLDYNLQGAFHQGFITHEEAVQLFHEFQWTGGAWISSEHTLLKKLVRFSIFMSQDCWGSGTEYLLSTWLAEAILRGLDIGLITMPDIRFGIDQDIWNGLIFSNDPLIQRNMHMIQNAADYHTFVPPDEADLSIVMKFRGIDPYVIVDGQRVRLSTTDAVLAAEYYAAKDKMSQGWWIKLTQAALHLVD